jgi:LAO/AO transport system kinase
VAEDTLARLRENPRALPRLATLVENEDPRGLEALDALYPFTGAAHVVGLTGPPGVGKSTIVAALLQQIRVADRRAAVLAVDPSSPLTGGAVLGDRIRMMDHHADAAVFVRSMASRGRRGGLAWATAELVHLIDAAGFPLILVETVGTGQDGTDIAALADTVIVVEAPGLGDGVQGIKSGLLEVADVVVVNKADQPGANETFRMLRASFALAHPPQTGPVPILPLTATTGDGIADLLAAIDRHSVILDETGLRASKRQLGARAELLAGLRLALDRRDIDDGNTSQFAQLLARVTRRELTPRRAVAALTKTLVKEAC